MHCESFLYVSVLRYQFTLQGNRDTFGEFCEYLRIVILMLGAYYSRGALWHMNAGISVHAKRSDRGALSAPWMLKYRSALRALAQLCMCICGICRAQIEVKVSVELERVKDKETVNERLVE